MSQQGSNDQAGTAEGRALVLIDRPSPSGQEGSRPLAQFLAQMIACRRNLAPFRKARRAEPGSASLAYAPSAAPVRPMRLDVSF